nr:DDE-type integrase/transposase/recombinase [Acaryochloris sp. IP29b_bin.137]
MIATDGLTSYPQAIEEELGGDVEHEVCPCTENSIEQSHRPVKHRYHLTLRFGKFGVVHQLCEAIDEVSNFLRSRSRMAELASLSDKRKKSIQ